MNKFYEGSPQAVPGLGGHVADRGGTGRAVPEKGSLWVFTLF
jgi:hypothetical protein